MMDNFPSLNNPAGIFTLLTELNNFTSLNVFFQRGAKPPPPGRFNPPIASMAVCEVWGVNNQKGNPIM